jgi:GNAT superfamily N-acetyltransferase
LFVSFGCPSLGAFRALSLEISRRVSRPLYVSVHGDDTRTIAGLLHGGYSAEVVAEKFDVGFEPVLRLVGGTAPPSRFALISASSADVEALSDLDNDLRQLVPGSEGWRADSDWVRAELEEAPPFDPASYLVGVAPDGSNVGLARIWRNPEGPRFGLVAVKPAFRTTRLGPALIAGVVGAASKWGFDTFTTETSIGNRHIHPRLNRLGARSTGFVYQFVFESEPSGERG